MAFNLNYFTPTYNTPSLKSLVAVLNNSFSSGNSYAAYGLSAPVVTNNIVNYNASTIVNNTSVVNNTSNYTNNVTNNTYNTTYNNTTRFAYGGFWGGYGFGGYGYGGYGYRGMGW